MQQNLLIPDQMIKVLLLIGLSNEYDRKLLRGIVQYSKDYGPWIFYRMPQVHTWSLKEEKRIVSWAKKWKANAIIGRWNGAHVDLLKELGIPVILQNNEARSKDFGNISGDYIGTGRLAAGFLMKKNLHNFAYFGNRSTIWSSERRQGFEDEINKAFQGTGNGSIVHVFETDTEKEMRNTELAQWLVHLPKPVGIYCCDDRYALSVTEASRICNIDIPGEITLLGTDNDELICEISDPPISSIALNVEKIGYLTGKMLHQRLLENSTEPFTTTVYPTEIFERASTSKYNITDSYIKQLVEYIDRNHQNDINVKRLIDLIPLSRRSLEQRFKKEMNTTIYQYLLECRINHVANLLVTTDKSLGEIAAECGFTNHCNLARTFRKFKGCIPAEYRKKNSFQRR